MSAAVTRLLLVEDNPADARLIQHLLTESAASSWGVAPFEFLVARCLAEATPLLSRTDLAVVLLDLSLPDSTGLATVRSAHALAPNTPIVVLTGLDDNLIGLQAVHEGAQDYLVKGDMDATLLVRAIRYAIERQRLRARAQAEAQLAAALARLGREMISLLNTPLLLDRLCRLTSELLPCDFSNTWLWDADEQAFVPVAGFGFRDEEWESLRLMKLPQASVAPLQTNDLMTMLTAERHQRIFNGIAKQYGVTLALYVALRRGGDLIGVQICGQRGSTTPFSDDQMRLATGIGQLASMALENARLVEELERANRIKSTFVAAMSHELRSPLNTIMGYTELLLDGNFGQVPQKQQGALETVRDCAGELRDVINATLDLSRFETKRVPLDLQPLSMDDLIDELTREIRGQPAKPAVDVSWEVAGGLALHTDRVKLKMVVKNLVTNAIKFTERGRVRISAHARDDGIAIDVTDTGIGIPPALQAAIFEPFRQADRTIGERYGGVGLGLYIVRQLLTMLGGTITLDSAPGRGSSFHVWVPCAFRPAAEPRSAVPASG